ncbi:hypothetical protein CRYUN_Cryun36dG0068200 [Craigia yunnanensis]
MRRRNFTPKEAVTSMLLHLAVGDSQCHATLESLPVPDALQQEIFEYKICRMWSKIDTQRLLTNMAGPIACVSTTTSQFFQH